MKKFAFIGAGSLQFASSAVRAQLTFDAFRPCEIALMDINRQNLDSITKVCHKIVEEMDCPECVITATQDRAKALQDADGVLCPAFNGDIDIWQYDITISQKIRS